jgi:acyl-CoA thioesterase-1
MKFPLSLFFRPLLVVAAGFGATLRAHTPDTPESLAVERAGVQKQFPEAFAPVVDDPALPRVLLIGDSISIGYTPFVRAALKGVANVHRVPENGGPTIRGLKQLPWWLGTGKWDVIHFNWGLHDLKRDETDTVQVPIADYEKNLRTLVAQLKATGAKLVFASTTPVPGRTSNRREEDVLAYNAVALRVMKEAGIPVNDLHSLAQSQLSEIQLPNNVHYTPKGYEVLSVPVIAAVRAQLPKK